MPLQGKNLFDLAHKHRVLQVGLVYIALESTNIEARRTCLLLNILYCLDIVRRDVHPNDRASHVSKQRNVMLTPQRPPKNRVTPIKNDDKRTMITCKKRVTTTVSTARNTQNRTPKVHSHS